MNKMLMNDEISYEISLLNEILVNEIKIGRKSCDYLLTSQVGDNDSKPAKPVYNY